MGPESDPEVGAEAQTLAPTLTPSSPILLMLSPGLRHKERRFLGMWQVMLRSAYCPCQHGVTVPSRGDRRWSFSFRDQKYMKKGESKPPSPLSGLSSHLGGSYLGGVGILLGCPNHREIHRGTGEVGNAPLSHLPSDWLTFSHCLLSPEHKC